MNSVVLKGKLGAGFNDDRYTLPMDGNPGDILVKTETGSAWKKQEPAASGGRVFVTGTMVQINRASYIATDQTEEQIKNLYDSGKDVILAVNTIEGSEVRLSYDGTLFHGMTIISKNTTINKIALVVLGSPMLDSEGRQTLWYIGQFMLAAPE